MSMPGSHHGDGRGHGDGNEAKEGRIGSHRLRNRGGPIALLLAVGLNVAQFAQIDRETAPHNRAIHQFASDDLIELGVDASLTIRERYGIHLALAELAPGSSVLIPESSPYASRAIISRLYGFGGVADVRIVSSEAMAGWVGLPTNLEAYVVARGGRGLRGAAPWAIAVNTSYHAVGNTERPQAFLRQALSAGKRGSSAGPPREFLFLRWEQPHEESGYEFQDLLLDTSLSPITVGRVDG